MENVSGPRMSAVSRFGVTRWFHLVPNQYEQTAEAHTESLDIDTELVAVQGTS